MAGDSEMAGALTEDLHALKEVVNTGGISSVPRVNRWRVLAPTGQRDVSLRQRLNPFVASRESTKPPTALYVHDADKLGKMRTQVVAQMKELETKLTKAKEKKSQETRAAEAAAQQKLIEQQMQNMNLQKSDMLKLLEGLEAKFVSDERRIHQMKKLAGVDSSPPPAVSPPPAAAAAATSSPQRAANRSPVRIRDESKRPFERPSKRQ
jgi:hypothetical protein